MWHERLAAAAGCAVAGGARLDWWMQSPLQLLTLGLLTVNMPLWAETLTWNPPGGDEEPQWQTGAGGWLDGDAVATDWVAGADAAFAGAGGALAVVGRVEAGALRFAAGSAYTVGLDNGAGAQLEVGAIAGAADFGFTGVIGADADAYPALETLRTRGLVVRPQETVTFGGRLRSVLGGSPVLGVRGTAGRVDFAGRWDADTGSIISWLVPLEGGHIRFTEAADMRFFKEALYTLQLWVHSDGTGVVELAEGFVADRTDRGALALGIGSMRFSGATLISHHSQNLPIGYRPKTAEAVQANGHLVFENSGGNRWIVRSNPQTYAGAVWLHRDLEIVAEADLTHTGVTEFNSDYTALNGWSVYGGVVKKSGPGRVTLAGEQSYRDGSLWEVLEGALHLATDPSAGQHRDGGRYSGTLSIRGSAGTEVALQVGGQIAGLESAGRVVLGAPVEIEGYDGLWLEDSSVLAVTLTDSTAALLKSVHWAQVGGTVEIRALPDMRPPVGTEYTLLESPQIDGAWTLVDHTEFGLELQVAAGRIFVRTTRAATGLAGTLLLDEPFEDISAWTDLSTVPRWGSPLGNRSAFEVVDGAVQLDRSGADSTVVWTAYANASGLKTFTALDYQFGEPLQRDAGVLTIDARLHWDGVTSSSGEAGRFILALNHAYPQGGLDLTPEGAAGSKLNDASAAWWARPAYHLRLRNSTTRAGGSFLQYGGGKTHLGEYEKTQNWWLPGFISGAGGIAPGNGDDFPANSWVQTTTGMATAQARWFRYVVRPEQIELWRDDDGDGFFAAEELQAVLPTPLESDAPYYNYFTQFEGLRLFWNGGDEAGVEGDAGQVYVDHVRVALNAAAGPEARLTLPSVALITNGVDGVVTLDARGSESAVAGGLLYEWWVDGERVAQLPVPVAPVRMAMGTRIVRLRVTDAAGSWAEAQAQVVLTPGNLLPLADAGPDQTATANDRMLALVTLDGSGSRDTDGSITAYRWEYRDGRLLYAGLEAQTTVVLPVGLHTLRLVVTDDQGAIGSAQTVVNVVQAGGAAEQLLYRENFARRSDGVEMGPWAVGWDLMRFDGAPVASVQYDGNAHRSLTTGGFEYYLPKVNADPLGSEYTADGALGHMWMNQMPYQNATPAEWMLWTQEYAIDTAQWELAAIEFHATDGSPERVKVAPALRIAGQWYVRWEARVETRYNTWRKYRMELGAGGWVRFDPSIEYQVKTAEVAALPQAEIEGFGLYFYKDYGWYVNEVDNIEVYARPRAQVPPFLAWQLGKFAGATLYNDSLESSVWGWAADADGDGYANGLEYALGTEPLAAEMAGSVLQIGADTTTGQVTVRWRQQTAADAALELWATADLAQWHVVETARWEAIEAEADWTRWQVMPQAGERYFRLAVAR